LAAVTSLNFLAQTPYYLPHAAVPLPAVHAAAMMGTGLAWLALGLAGCTRGRSWGFAVLVSFGIVEVLFYAMHFAEGAFVMQLESQSDLRKAVFALGYASAAAAGYYLYRLFRQRAQLVKA
jgi:hypothetical protein